MYPTETEIDTVSDSNVATAGCLDEIPGLNDWIDDNRRNEEAELEARVVAEIAGSEFGDLTPERHEEIMSDFPTGRGWIPVIAFEQASGMFGAQLRRGTKAGPDVAYLGNYLSAECALLVCVAFAREMVIAAEINDPEWVARLKSKITYAVA
jgi:hypothetical protein